ncbi:unnamed protein product [Echinostoma caproni]|uniref:Transmembrane protein n=1 Tax=Echinostoma caproni TaxID=27848 RepID=A0A183BFZ2_9TREM|nr:unnamed protein product [Echinostoma caproni]
MKHISLDVEVVGFPDESTMVSYLLFNDSAKSFFGAVVYDGKCSSTNLSYTIRLRNEENWFTYLLYPHFIQRRPRSFEFHASPPAYYSSGFLAIQHTIDEAITSKLCGQNPAIDFKLSLKRMPFPPYLNDYFVDVIQSQFSDVIVLGIMFPVLHAIRLTLTEKQKGTKLLAQHYHELGLATKLILSLIPSIGMGFAGMLVGKFEGRGK